MVGGRSWSDRRDWQPWPAGPRSWLGVVWSGRQEWSHLFAFQQLHSSLLPHGLREDTLSKLVEHGPGFPGGAKAQCPVQGVGHRLHTLPGQGLKTHGQVGPAKKRPGRERDLDAVRDPDSGLTHEKPADLIGVFDHFLADGFWKFRTASSQEFLLGVARRIAHLAQPEAIEKGEVLPKRTLVQTRLVGSPIGIGRGCETEHGVRDDEFTAILSDAQRLTIKNTVQACGGSRFEQVELIEEEQPAIFHGQGQGPVFVFHAAVTNRQVPHQIGELQAAVSSDLEDGIIESGGELLDGARFTAACRTEDIQGIGYIHEPDRDVAACLVEDVAGIRSRRVAAGAGIATDDPARRAAAEDRSCVQLHGLEFFEFVVNGVGHVLLHKIEIPAALLRVAGICWLIIYRTTSAC